MPIVTTQRKKQRNLIMVMGGVLLVTATVLYMGFGRGEGRKNTGVIIDTSVSGSVTVSRGFELDTSILMDERFRQLIPYTEIQGVIETGRDNPFASYNASTEQSVQEVATSTNATSTEE